MRNTNFRMMWAVLCVFVASVCVNQDVIAKNTTVKKMPGWFKFVKGARDSVKRVAKPPAIPKHPAAAIITFGVYVGLETALNISSNFFYDQAVHEEDDSEVIQKKMEAVLTAIEKVEEYHDLGKDAPTSWIAVNPGVIIDKSSFQYERFYNEQAITRAHAVEFYTQDGDEGYHFDLENSYIKEGPTDISDGVHSNEFLYPTVLDHLQPSDFEPFYPVKNTTVSVSPHIENFARSYNHRDLMKTDPTSFFLLSTFNTTTLFEEANLSYYHYIYNNPYFVPQDPGGPGVLQPTVIPSTAHGFHPPKRLSGLHEGFRLGLAASYNIKSVVSGSDPLYMHAKQSYTVRSFAQALKIQPSIRFLNWDGFNKDHFSPNAPPNVLERNTYFLWDDGGWFVNTRRGILRNYTGATVISLLGEFLTEYDSTLNEDIPLLAFDKHGVPTNKSTVLKFNNFRIPDNSIITWRTEVGGGFAYRDIDGPQIGRVEAMLDGDSISRAVFWESLQ